MHAAAAVMHKQGGKRTSAGTRAHWRSWLRTRILSAQCKARLGAIVHKKTATALAVTAVKNEVRARPPAGKRACARWGRLVHRLRPHARVQRLGAGGAASLTRAPSPPPVASQDQREFGKLAETFKAMYNDAPRTPWGGHILGPKSQIKHKKRERAIARELAQRTAVV